MKRVQELEGENQALKNNVRKLEDQLGGKEA
jgi:hypothetical protein